MGRSVRLSTHPLYRRFQCFGCCKMVEKLSPSLREALICSIFFDIPRLESSQSWSDLPILLPRNLSGGARSVCPIGVFMCISMWIPLSKSTGSAGRPKLSSSKFSVVVVRWKCSRNLPGGPTKFLRLQKFPGVRVRPKLSALKSSGISVQSKLPGDMFSVSKVWAADKHPANTEECLLDPQPVFLSAGCRHLAPRGHVFGFEGSGCRQPRAAGRWHAHRAWPTRPPGPGRNPHQWIGTRCAFAFIHGKELGATMAQGTSQWVWCNISSFNRSVSNCTLLS